MCIARLGPTLPFTTCNTSESGAPGLDAQQLSPGPVYEICSPANVQTNHATTPVSTWLYYRFSSDQMRQKPKGNEVPQGGS